MNFDLYAIYTAGLLTFTTPCVLPVIPIYISLLIGVPFDELSQAKRTVIFRLLVNTALFIVGFLLVFVAMGLSATAIGSLLVEYRGHLMILGGLLIFLSGLKFLGYLRIDILDREKRLGTRGLDTTASTVNAFVLGFVFALGWTPCIGPILGSIIAYTASHASDPVQGATYLATYGLGFATPLLLVSVFTGAAKKAIAGLAAHLPKIATVTGVPLCGVGVAVMLGALGIPHPRQIEVASLPSADAEEVGLPPEMKGPRLVEFYSPKCSVCVQMRPIVARVEKDCMGKNIAVARVDVTSAKNRDLVSQYRIRGLPTFILFDSDGNEAARLIGYQPYNTLMQVISSLTGEQCEGLGLLPEELTAGGGGNEGQACE